MNRDRKALGKKYCSSMEPFPELILYIAVGSLHKKSQNVMFTKNVFLSKHILTLIKSLLQVTNNWQIYVHAYCTQILSPALSPYN